MHDRHQLCTETQHNEEKQIQRQVPLWASFLNISLSSFKPIHNILRNLTLALLLYSADSSGYLHVSGKAGHEASKGAVDYYNASFVDVSYMQQ